MAQLQVSGLTNCDSCRKARRDLAAAGHQVTFRDLRDSPPSRDEIRKLSQDLGDSILNRASTTWRGLSAQEQAEPAIDLLLRYPALMKRPLVESAARKTLGWTAAVQKIWLGPSDEG